MPLDHKLLPSKLVFQSLNYQSYESPKVHIYEKGNIVFRLENKNVTLYQKINGKKIQLLSLGDLTPSSLRKIINASESFIQSHPFEKDFNARKNLINQHILLRTLSEDDIKFIEKSNNIIKDFANELKLSGFELMSYNDSSKINGLITSLRVNKDDINITIGTSNTNYAKFLNKTKTNNNQSFYIQFNFKNTSCTLQRIYLDKIEDIKELAKQVEIFFISNKHDNRLKEKLVDFVKSTTTDKKITIFKICHELALRFNSTLSFKEEAKAVFDYCYYNRWIDKLSKHFTDKKYISHETKIVHPLFEEECRKRNISFRHEYKINNESRVDYVLFIQGKMIPVELKSDNMKWSLAHLNRQKNKYDQGAKEKGLNFEPTLIASPHGTYGYSFDNLFNLLINLY